MQLLIKKSPVDEINDIVVKKICPCHCRAWYHKESHVHWRPQDACNNVHGSGLERDVEGLFEYRPTKHSTDQRVHGILSKHLDPVDKGDWHGGSGESPEGTRDDGNGPEEELVGGVETVEEAVQAKRIGTTVFFRVWYQYHVLAVFGISTM